MFSAVLDSAAGTAFLAAFEDGRKLFQSSAPMRGREAARLLALSEEELAERMTRNFRRIYPEAI